MSKLNESEKIKLADKISDFYFEKNFGSMSKSDFETFLFSVYVEHCLDADEDIDDYTLSKQLGITQSRVRTLKERKELKYPREKFNWKESFANEIKNAKYDQNDHYVKVIIQDVNVMIEIRHLIEEKGWYDECSLNKKLLRIPLDCFTEICLKDEDTSQLFTEENKKLLKKIASANPELNSILDNFSQETLKKFFMSASKEAILLVIQALPFGGIAGNAFKFLEKVLIQM